MANFIWWSAIVIEAIVLLRGASTNLIKRYPLFFGYLACIFLTEITRLCVYSLAPTHYGAVYWYSELADIVASYAVIIEIFRKALRNSAGLARLAKNLLYVIFVVTASYSATDLLAGGFAFLPLATADLGRDLRCVEAALLLVILWLFARYRIPLGRNLGAIALGNAFWVGTSVINIALLSSPGKQFSVLLRQLLPVTYLIALAVWCLGLWTADPERAHVPMHRMDFGYAIVAMKTRTIFASATDRLIRAVKP